MWKTVKLGDVCLVTDYVANGSFQSLKENVKYLDEDGFAILVRLTDFTKGWNGKYKYVSEDAYNFLNKSTLYAGDLVISNVGEPGKTFLVPNLGQPMTLAPNSILVRPNDESLSTEYLKYFIDSKYGQDLIRSIESGTTQRKFNKTSFRALKLPLPPLAEQQRIVAKLDAAFAEIDKIVALSERSIQEGTRLYEYAIDDMFNSYANKYDELGKYCDINYGYTAKASATNGSFKLLRITDIQDKKVDWDTVPYCEVENHKIDRVRLRDGDIVFARTGATTGKSFLVENPKNAVFASYLIRVSVDRKKLCPRFVMHYFQSASYWNQVNDGISGAAQGGFNASKLATLLLPIIEMSEQTRVVNRLDELSNGTSILNSVYKNKLLRIASLKSAILTQALQPPQQ
mgnify:CR=1 FL=1